MANQLTSAIFTDKTLLITGGTGTFGNAVVDMACKTGFGEIRIFSRDEKKQDDMRGRIRNAAVKFYLGDVRSYDSVLQAMRGVDFVFHAAALKQVPSCEFFPIEAVQTNTLGAENVMKAALASSVGQSDRAQHGQGGLSGERDGDVQSAHGEMHGGQGADVWRPSHGVLRDAVWKRDGFPGLGDTAVSESDSGWGSR